VTPDFQRLWRQPFVRIAQGRLASASRLWHHDPLSVGIAVSIVLHAFLLMLRFAPPLPLKYAPVESQIEVVLLNARSDTKPLKAEVVAQVDMEGGGDRDKGRARSPLPAQSRIEDGNDLLRTTRRVAKLEEEQRRLLELAKGPQSYVAPEKKSAESPPTTLLTEADEEINQVIARMQAQIDKQISDYNKRPKRLTYGVNAKGVAYAVYVDDWADRIERIGTERYPPDARGKFYDSLICTVEIDKTGNVVDVILNKRSKYEVLNKSVRQIVYSGAPYPRFSPEMARQGDILQIVRTWNFTREGLQTEAFKPK
jgi:periplasmic protein TonB